MVIGTDNKSPRTVLRFQLKTPIHRHSAAKGRTTVCVSNESKPDTSHAGSSGWSYLYQTLIVVWLGIVKSYYCQNTMWLLSCCVFFSYVGTWNFYQKIYGTCMEHSKEKSIKVNSTFKYILIWCWHEEVSLSNVKFESSANFTFHHPTVNFQFDMKIRILFQVAILNNQVITCRYHMSRKYHNPNKNPHT